MNQQTDVRPDIRSRFRTILARVNAVVAEREARERRREQARVARQRARAMLAADAGETDEVEARP